MITKPVSDFLKQKKIQEIVGVAATTTVADAVALMNRNDVGSVLVKRPDGAVEGIFTERDLMRRVVAQNRDARSTPIGTVMSRDVRLVPVSATLEEALRLMVEYGHRHLLVEESGKPRALISIRDLMRWTILPDEPIAHEGRGGVIRARAEDTIRSVQGGS